MFTNLILLSIKQWLLDQFWWLFILVIVILCLLLIIRIRLKPKKQLIQVIDSEQVAEFIKLYGGIENIEHAEVDGKRLKIKVIDIEKVELEQFKRLGASGIFISGNHIKMVLDYDMEQLVNQINQDLNGGKQ